MRQKDAKSSKGDAAKFTLALKRGIVLADRYQIEELLADSSSFALTYLATDVSAEDANGASVAIKEFLPRIFVGRARDGHTVKPHSPADATEFARSLRRFVHEGKILVDIASPYLVHVQRCLESNGTGYLVMDVHQGRPLSTALGEAGGRISARDAVALILRLLDPLERLQAEGVFHRAISPDAVNVTESWEPILHGFSARRHVQGQVLELAPGFAAFEQYASNNVGPWTDVYGCAALLYYLVTGVVPPTAIDRVGGKSLPPASAHVPDLSPSLSLAIARGLSLLPEQRPHGVAEFRKQLEGAPVEPVNVLTSSLVVGSALEAQHVVALNDVEAVDPIALELAADGRLVLPRGDETVVPRFQRVFGRLAERARDRVRSVMPETSRFIGARTEVPEEAAVEDQSDEAAPVKLEPELIRAPLVLVDESETPAPKNESPAPTLDPLVLQGRLVELYRSDVRRRITRYVTASVLTVVVIGSAYGAMASRRTPDVPKPRVATTAARKPVTGSQPVAPTRAVVSGALATERSAAQQGALSDGEPAPATNGSRPSPERAEREKKDSAATASKDLKSTAKAPPPTATPKPPASRPVDAAKPPAKQPVVMPKPTAPQPVTVSPPAKPDKKTVPVDVLSDVEGRLASGDEEAGIGLYSLARRIYRSAMTVTDAALAKYSQSDTLRSIRTQLNQADQRALRACQAENDSLKKSRRPTIPCE